MENIYTEQNIAKFFDGFKTLKNSYNIEKVHQLLVNPNAKAKHRVQFYFKPLKLIIMISIILISILTFFLTLSSDNNLDVNSIEEIYIDKNILPNKEDIPSTEKTMFEKSFKNIELKSKKANNKTNKPAEENITQINTTPKGPLEVNSNFENKKESNEVSKIEIENCNWPLDTIIDKKNLLVELTDRELNEIGIVKYGKEIYYNNLSSNGHINSSNINSEIIPDEKKVQTNYDFYRVTQTTINYVPYFNADLFYSSLDTLVPIILRVEKPNIIPIHPDIIYWFNPHQTLFEKLPVRYNYLKDVYSNLQCLKRKYPNKSFTNYLSPLGNNIFNPVNSINLNKEELQQIGINIIENCIVLQSKDYKQYSSFCACSDCGHDKSYYDSINIVRVSKNSMPVLITDTLGRKIMFDGFPRNHQIIETNMNVLIPIKIDKDKLLNKNGYNTELWWYYPSDEFIQTLPNRIKNKLKSERDAIISNENIESSSCTYFEVCKSTLNLDKLKLYPNPALSSVTLEFVSPENMTVSISIINISGSIVKELLPTASIHTGSNSYVFDLSGIGTGIYLISINTNKGFITQRLIISQ